MGYLTQRIRSSKTIRTCLAIRYFNGTEGIDDFVKSVDIIIMEAEDTNGIRFGRWEEERVGL